MVCIHTKQSKLDNYHGTEIKTFLDGIPNEQLEQMVDIAKPWSLKKTCITTFSEANENGSIGVIELFANVDRAGRWKCPYCGADAGVYRYEERKFRTVPFMKYQVWIVAMIPVLRCGGCNKHPRVEVPWARPHVGYTIELERLVMRNLDDRSIMSAAQYLDIGDWVVADIVNYRVTEALKKLDLSNVSVIYLDETSSKKGHNYITVICDQDKRIIFMCEGKDASTVDKFAVWLKEHGGSPEKIEIASCDMGLAYPAGVRQNFKQAMIVFDKFHVIKLLTEAFNSYYNRITKKDLSIPKANFIVYKHEDDFTRKQREMYEIVANSYSELAEAFRIKEIFCRIYKYGCKESASIYFDMWYEYIKKCSIPELRTAAESLYSRKESILMWYDCQVNNGFAEGMNSLIQTTKRVGRGYRNVTNFINMCYLKNSHLDMSF